MDEAEELLYEGGDAGGGVEISSHDVDALLAPDPDEETVVVSEGLKNGDAEMEQEVAAAAGDETANKISHSGDSK